MQINKYSFLDLPNEMQVRSFRAAFIYNVKGCITTSFDCDKMFYGTLYLISVACYEAHEKS